MPAKKPTGARNETVRCENCGEYYAVTYKRCPFCEEREDRRYAARRRGGAFEDEYEDAYDDDLDEYDARGGRGGGKRLVTNTRGGGYGRGPSPMQVIGTVLSLALIVAAIYIVITWLKPIIDRGKTGPVPEASPTPPITSVSPAPSTQASPAPTGSAGPGASDSPGQAGDPGTLEPQPTPDTSAIPDGQTAVSFSLGQSDFTLSNEWPTYTFKPSFSPVGSTGTITWESSKPDVVSVDQNGVVRGLTPGNATVTATMAGGYKQTCIVRSTVSGGGGSSVTASSAPSQNADAGALTLNHTDFTFSSVDGPPVSMRVNGASGAPVWSVKDASIATIDENGVVRPVSKGRTTIVATVDGQTLECIVRCSW